MTLKVAIFGAGAVGSVLAAQLTRAGHQVTVIARGEHLHAIRKQGLHFQSTTEEFFANVEAYSSAEEAGPQDVVIVTVKAQALPNIAKELCPLLREDTPIVFAQNGLPWWYTTAYEASSALLEQVGLERTIGCVIHCPCSLIAPGQVRVFAARGRFIIGEPDNQLSTRLVNLQQQFSPTLEVAVTDNLQQHIWQKLCINLPGSLLSTLTHSYTADIIASPILRGLFLTLITETRAVAAAHGYLLADEGDELVSKITQIRHAPSMLQDLLAGRPLEIDAQLSAVQRLARVADVPTPNLDLLLPLLLQRSLSTAQILDS